MATIRQPFTIGTLSRRSGCSIDAIRYYERMQLMPRVPRSEGGHRLYDDRHVARLAFIRRGRQVGLSLEQVRDLLDNIERKACGCGKIRPLLEERAAEVKHRLADLQKQERNLRLLIGICGDATAADCRVVEVLLAGDDPAPGVQCCSDVDRMARDAHEREHFAVRKSKPD